MMMTGAKGKSGGRRAGAGRKYDSITLRLGDQFYVPMHGLAEVVEISANQFKVKIDDERLTFTARSRRKSQADPITKRAIAIWGTLPGDVLGNMPHTYNIRCTLYEEFPDADRAHVANCAMQAIRMLKQERKKNTP
jgi:hypothetical protein